MRLIKEVHSESFSRFGYILPEMNKFITEKNICTEDVISITERTNEHCTFVTLWYWGYKETEE